MTTRVARQDMQSNRGRGAVLGMTAVTLIILGAALWQLRPGAEATPPGIGDVPATAVDGVRVGGAGGAHPAGLQASTDAAAPLDVPTFTDGAGHFFTEQPLSAAPSATHAVRELHRDLGAGRTEARGGASGACGPTGDAADC